ncbi:MAG: PilZ domain-containing protein [Myxococcales bacterium]|nr:PilZ domain-containing protein [Myxococcales bacterium]
MTGADDLLGTALAAAREIREALARMLHALEAADPSEAPLTGTDELVGATRRLFAMEPMTALGPADATECAHGNLSDALLLLRRLLVRLQNAEGAGARRDELASGIAKALARLHPIHAALGRVFEPRLGAAAPSPPAEPPAPLRSAAEKPATPPRKPTLMLVPEEDEPPAELEPAPPAAAASDRRREVRERIDVELGLHSETNFFTGFGGDVSEGGIFVATYERLPVGAELTVHLVLPSGYALSALGRVRWVREALERNSALQPGLGIGFERLEPADLRAIQEFTREREPLFHDD